MILFSLETSCDETACAVFEWHSDTEFTILSEQLNSQVDIHKEYGGVYPAVAKREHTNNTFPLFIAVVEEAGLLERRVSPAVLPADLDDALSNILSRDELNLKRLQDFYREYEVPKIDAIAVTYGPGLEIALWTGFNFARALSLLCDAELVPTNHMEGHIYASLIEERKDTGTKRFVLTPPMNPSLALLVSGGHTELVLIESEHEYKKVGVTQDDAAGEAFDKSARLVGIDYPGGPMISKLAAEHREQPFEYDFVLPRPMIDSGNLHFSFSGLKTAVRKVVETHEQTETFKRSLSFELESAITEVLEKKSKKAIDQFAPKMFILGGGVSASTTIRERLRQLCAHEEVRYFVPEKKYSGDNAVMIGIAGYRRFVNKKHNPIEDRVSGRLPLGPLHT